MVSHFIGETGMKLPSYLVQSRHGIFYFRLTYFSNSTRKEKRWSLRTRNPVEAKRMSLHICAALRDNCTVQGGASGNGSSQIAGAVRIEQIHRKGGIDMAEDNWVQLITTFQSPRGDKITLEIDQSDPKDIAAAKQMAQTILRENVKLVSQSNNGEVIANPAFDAGSFFPPHIGQSKNCEISSGETFQVSIDRFASRKTGSLADKTIYEYGKMQSKFYGWLRKKRSTADFYTHSVIRADIAGFIDYLMDAAISKQTIQKKYLASLSGLFEFAQSTGAFPQGDVPTKGHQLFTQHDKKKVKAKAENKLFDEDDLEKIFNPKNLLARDKPCDFWLPLLGLFIGARITELCQLKTGDIKQVNGIWVIDINDEGNKTVKTAAGIRKIPLHPKLIELGFLEYLEDVRPYNGTIFPYMTPDKYRHYGKTPGRRFGDYLDKLGITDERKVFHSFRTTANNRLKQNGVPEESRCQFIGHEYSTVNSSIYSAEHDMQFLLDNVANKLTFPSVDFSQIKYPRQKLVKKLSQLMKVADKKRSHKQANALREKSFF